MKKNSFYCLYKSMIILFLMQINRINIFIIKSYFKRRIKRKVRWTSHNEIVNGIILTNMQIFERIFIKIKPSNFLIMTSFFFYGLLSLISLFFLLIPLISLYSIENIKKYEDIVRVENFKENHEYKPITCKRNMTIEELIFFKDQLTLYEVSNVKEEKISDLPIVIRNDNLMSKNLNEYGKNSLNFRNAGGKSEISEAYSITHLSNNFFPKSCIYEMNVSYWCKHKLLDYIMELDDYNIGVSVVRAFSSKKEFTEDFANFMLSKKINGLISSRKTVSDKQLFNESILHILSPSKDNTEILLNCLNSSNFSSENFHIVGEFTIWITTCCEESIFTNEF